MPNIRMLPLESREKQRTFDDFDNGVIFQPLYRVELGKVIQSFAVEIEWNTRSEATFLTI